jgi:hypothetical protein
MNNHFQLLAWEKAASTAAQISSVKHATYIVSDVSLVTASAITFNRPMGGHLLGIPFIESSISNPLIEHLGYGGA